MISRFMIMEIPVWNEGGECGGCGDPEGYGAPLEAAGEEPGLIGQWLSTELKNQSGQNITYGMYFGDYQYFEFQYGQMGHDLECWSGSEMENSLYIMCCTLLMVHGRESFIQW